MTKFVFHTMIYNNWSNKRRPLSVVITMPTTAAVLTLSIITIESAQRPREHSPDQCRLRNTVQNTTLSTSTISTTLYFTQDTCKYIYTTYCKYTIVLVKVTIKVKFKLGGLNTN